MKPETRAVKSLALNLSHFRRLNLFSQEELAARAGVDRGYISDLERGLRNPSLKVLARIAAALNLRIGQLCDP